MSERGSEQGGERGREPPRRPPARPERPPPPRKPPAARHLRPAGFDDLGLERALSDRLLPLLVAAMAFLAALAFAGAMATATLAQHWQQGAAAELTVQVPTPSDPATVAGRSRPEAVLAILRSEPGLLRATPDEQRRSDRLA